MKPESLPPSRLSIVIPARNETGSIEDTILQLYQVLSSAAIVHEIVVVDDHSTDATFDLVSNLSSRIKTIVPIRNTSQSGFGSAVRLGLEAMSGDAVIIFMADGSDDSLDVIRYWKLLQEGAECVFGSRFIPGGRVYDYPPHKLILNRLANHFIKALFRVPLNDTTNAFKAYRSNVIRGCQPLLSMHFNLTVELPLKAIVRGYKWTVIPISWRNRKAGIAKFKIKEMGSRYFFIIMYVWLEKYFSRGDYYRRL